jgi:hypothetical protein
MKTRIFWAAFALLAFMLVAAIAYAVHEQWVVYSKGSNTSSVVLGGFFKLFT